MAGFKDIIGQESVVTHFKNAIKLHKISHAYIINGEQGMGKKTIARAFSMTMQCEKKGEFPCMECRSCKQAMTDNNPDIRWVVHEKTGVITVDEVREQINGDILVKPYSNDYKIYIVPEADKMNTAAQNAILKTIEEPPAYAVIILLTDNREKLLETILSRCVAMDLKPVRRELVENYLVENEAIVDYRAREVSAFAGGNIGKAIKMASSDDFYDLKEMVINIVKNIGNMSIADINHNIKEVSALKDNIGEFMDLMLLWYRDVLMYKACGVKAALVYRENERQIREQASKASYSGIEDILKEMDEVRWKLKVNVNFEMLMELLFMKMRDCVNV